MKPLSMAVSKLALPDISNFLLRFVKVISRKFISLCERGKRFQRHSAFWYPMISSSFFFSFIWFCHFYSSESQPFFLLLYFLKFAIHFVLKICGMFISNFWLVENSCSIIFREKTSMINQKSRALSDFLKIIYDQS